MQIEWNNFICCFVFLFISHSGDLSIGFYLWLMTPLFNVHYSNQFFSFTINLIKAISENQFKENVQ